MDTPRARRVLTVLRSVYMFAVLSSALARARVCALMRLRSWCVPNEDGCAWRRQLSGRGRVSG